MYVRQCCIKNAIEATSNKAFYVNITRWIMKMRFLSSNMIWTDSGTPIEMDKINFIYCIFNWLLYGVEDTKKGIRCLSYGRPTQWMSERDKSEKNDQMFWNISIHHSRFQLVLWLEGNRCERVEIWLVNG